MFDDDSFGCIVSGIIITKSSLDRAAAPRTVNSDSESRSTQRTLSILLLSNITTENAWLYKRITVLFNDLSRNLEKYSQADREGRSEGSAKASHVGTIALNVFFLSVRGNFACIVKGISHGAFIEVILFYNRIVLALLALCYTN